MATEIINAQGELGKELKRRRDVFENARASTVAACTAHKAASDLWQAAGKKLKKAADEENAAKQALRTASARWQQTVDPFRRAQVELRQIRRRLADSPPGSDNVDSLRQFRGEGPAHVVGAC